MRSVPSKTTPTLLRPRKAVVLAAGKGTRLRPFTLFQPKPLMALAGCPLIEYSLRQLESWGVREIAVNLHWQANLLRDYLKARQGLARFTISYEPQLLGTGGALRPLAGFVGAEPFWLVNADILWQVSPDDLQHAMIANRALATLWLVPGKGPCSVETDSRGVITTFRSTSPGRDGSATFSGVQLVRPEILRYMPERSMFTLVDLYERAARAGERVAGVRLSGKHTYWDDAGTVSVCLALRSGKVPIRPAKSGGDLPKVRERFRVDRGNRVWFPAMAWPEPVLVPFLVDCGWSPARTMVEPLPARGSDRRFLRIKQARRSAMFTRHGGRRAENDYYGPHAGLLRRAGVPVPRVLGSCPSMRALLMEDVGRVCLRDVVLARDDPGRIETYEQVMQSVLRLHVEGTRAIRCENPPMEAPFDERVFRWEHALFSRHMGTVVLEKSRRLEGFERDCDRVVRHLLTDNDWVAVHRDLQSTNILLHREKWYLIDFQGLRLGPASYDLASLLCDPYVSLSAPLRRHLLQTYAAAGPRQAKAAEWFAWAAVQRLMQALGAYGRLSALGLSEWGQYIQPAAVLLAEMAAECRLRHIEAVARGLLVAG